MHKAWAVAISKAHERPRRMSGTIKTTAVSKAGKLDLIRTVFTLARVGRLHSL